MSIAADADTPAADVGAARRMPATEYYPLEATRKKLRDGQRLTSPEELPVSHQRDLETDSKYIADDGLANALNVAVTLGQPLLLTGEPGTGKTQFAYSAAYWLGFSRLIRFNVKSTTQARDFFYQIDEVKRFRDAQILSLIRTGTDGGGSIAAELLEVLRTEALEIRYYMTLGPLGEAILRANRPDAFPMLKQPQNHAARERSIVLIDEVDKAPRDVPNDLLNEMENMEFEVPELKLLVKADADFRPVLVITSNSERNLPDAFLRRCIYYNIPFPGEDEGLGGAKVMGQNEQLNRIIAARLPNLGGNHLWMEQATYLFGKMRERGRGVQKLPGTAELLNWLLVLHLRGDLGPMDSLYKNPRKFEATLPILMKNKADVEIARRIFRAASEA